MRHSRDRRYWLAAVVLLALLGGCVLEPRRGVQDDIARGEAAISDGDLRSVIRYLADDALEGRAPGTRGDRLTRLYIASLMQQIGLEPAGTAGWEQPFELIGVKTITPRQWRFTRRGRDVSFAAHKDFVAVSSGEGPTAAIARAEVVFVGYGIQAPEYQWDDYKGANLRGKVLLMLNNDPDWDPQLFAGKRRLYYGRWTYKYESAARHGAVAAIIVHTDESAGYPWQTVQTSWSGENSRLPDASGPVVPIQAWMTEAAAKRLLALSNMDLDTLRTAARERSFQPVPLGTLTGLKLRTTVRRYQTANVLGAIVGRDSTLRDQAVVFTAHHDHLGTDKREGKTVIYNGALDNAAGVAQLLSVARAFAAAGDAPRRSVVFLAVAAEEQGLLGSAYYAAHPTFAPHRIVADINFDGGNIWGKTDDVAAVGYGKSTLDQVAEAAARRQGRVYVDEAFPERGSFYRSDQFNFAKIGVPALFLRPGTRFVGKPPEWGRQQVDAWIAAHYHQPSDDYDPAWDLGGMIDDARLAFAMGAMIADAQDIPRWVPGDEFEAVRQASQR